MTVYKYTDGGEVSSSAFEAVFYNEDNNTLYLVFTNGRVAAYIVLSSTYHALRDADSIGRFYNQYIYSHSSGVSVDQGCTFERLPVVQDQDDYEDTADQAETIPVQDVTKATEVVYEISKTYDYKVFYTVSSEECDVVTAVSVDDAIKQVEDEFRSISINVTKVEVEFV